MASTVVSRFIPSTKLLRWGNYLLNNCILMKENNCVISLRIKKDGTCSKHRCYIRLTWSLGQGMAISTPMMNFTKVNPFSEQDNDKAYIIFAQCIHKQVKEIDDIVPVGVRCQVGTNSRWLGCFSRLPTCWFWSLHVNLRMSPKYPFNSNAVKLKKQLYTWMQRLSRGDISFFRLSLSCPKIFSTHAVSCCLNSIAGYRASTCGRVSLRPTNFEGDLNVWKKHKYCYSSQKAKSILNDFFRKNISRQGT